MSGSEIPYILGFDGFRMFFLEGPGAGPVSSSRECLLDYVDEWLWSGWGVMNCSGDFQIFLGTVAIIIDEWHKTPDMLAFPGNPELSKPNIIEHRVGSVFPDGKRQHKVFDPHNFTAACYNWHHLDPHNFKPAS